MILTTTTTGLLIGMMLAVSASAADSSATTRPGRGGPGLTVFIGTYTGPKSKGIYRMQFRPDTGELSPPELAAELPSPSFLAVHPSGKFLYAVNEGGLVNGKKTGAVSALSIGAADGKLALLNQETSGGAGPCFVAVDHAGKNVLVANYGSGSVEVLPIGDDGRLKAPSAFEQHAGKGPNPQRQEGPHAHSINVDPADRFALAADLGLDKIFVYHLDPAAGTLAANDPPAADLAPGAGPRHLAFHPDGKFVYVINELANTVTVFSYDGDRGRLTELQTIAALPADFKGQSTTAEVVVHPLGKFLYGSNRGHDSIVAYSIDAQTGKLSLVGHTASGGKNPRNFVIDPTGGYLLAANQNSDNIVVFRIDPATGQLTATGVLAQVPSPVCVRFVPPG